MARPSTGKKLTIKETMDFLLILFAYLMGLVVRSIGLPPLIGYLVAGFSLNYLGFNEPGWLQNIADLGITLMLFTIGLKLNLRDLVKKEVLLGSLGNMIVWMILAALVILGLQIAAISVFAEINLKAVALIVFALSFSSTVCIVKILEEAGELKTRHGKLAIGILIMQDVVAVGFLVAATGVAPSIWSPLLIGLIFVKPLLGFLLDKSGHGELLILTGFFFALGGYELFYLFNIKGDFGALFAGVLLSHHSKATELYKALMDFKDIFLIGFFLSIGFTALPDYQMVFISLFFVALIPIKSLAFFFIFVKTRLRARTSYLSSLVLSNYSEFGLIVIAMCVANGWVGKEWLVISAIALSLSFVMTSMLYRKAHVFYSDWKEPIKKFESSKWINSDLVFQPIGAKVLIIGMGRVGKGAYAALHDLNPEKVWGMDADSDRIKKLTDEGMNVFSADGEDAELWENFKLDSIQLILLALPSVEDMQQITKQIQLSNFNGKIAAIARYEDQRKPLHNAGVDKIFNFYTEAGVGFAEESMALIDEDRAAVNET